MVEIWLIRAGLPADTISCLASVLSDEERARAAAYRRPQDASRYIAAHGAARRILAARLGIEPSQILWRTGPHGKPEIVGGPQINLSHSGNLAALAVSESRPVGVDIQEIPSRLHLARMASRFPADEAAYIAGDLAGDSAGDLAGDSAGDLAGDSAGDLAADLAADLAGDSAGRFARLWVRKEACAKAAGDTVWRALSLPVMRDAVPGEFLVTDIPMPAGFRGAVALAGDHPYRTVTRWWADAAGPRVGAGP